MHGALSVIKITKQTQPTLGFCVKRHLEILTFKPEPYWILDLGVYKKGRVYHAQWEGERSFNQQKIIDLAKKYLVDYISSKNI